jgi:ABC-type branched-subunit amino acid transport system ATPase component
VLEVKNYTAGYSKNQYLFDETTIKILPGSIVGIKGMNGCGKSTFIKGLINLIPEKKGEIYLNGINITKWETSRIFRTKQLGYLSQRNRVFNHLTVSEHIKLQLLYSNKFEIHSIPSYEILYSLIELKQDILASTLSGGEQLILNLLCLIILNPDVILLDEPSDSLDINIKIELKNLFLYWKEKNKSILLVEQNTNFQESVCNSILKLN